MSKRIWVEDETYAALAALKGKEEACADMLATFRRASVQRAFLWPIDKELVQFRILCEEVISTVEDTA